MERRTALSLLFVTVLTLGATAVAGPLYLLFVWMAVFPYAMLKLLRYAAQKPSSE